jgi:hypothetical protein
MSEQDNSLTPPRVHRRRSGQRLSKAERATAQEKFLKAFSMTANVRAACLSAGISRTTVYEWHEHDQDFSILFKQAELDANDLVRGELFRRAVQGVEKPVVSIGKLVYDKDGKPLMVREYSDNLLSLLAKARMPEFREKQQVDLNTTSTNTQDVKSLHDAIATALADYPEARIAVAAMLAEKGKAS